MPPVSIPWQNIIWTKLSSHENETSVSSRIYMYLYIYLSYNLITNCANKKLLGGNALCRRCYSHCFHSVSEKVRLYFCYDVRTRIWRQRWSKIMFSKNKLQDILVILQMVIINLQKPNWSAIAMFSNKHGYEIIQALSSDTHCPRLIIDLNNWHLISVCS